MQINYVTQQLKIFFLFQNYKFDFLHLSRRELSGKETYACRP